MSQAVAAGIFGAAVFAVATSALAAAVDPNSQAPEVGQSQPGNYLAGLIASADRDTSSAEVYYREALRVDPETQTSLSAHLPRRWQTATSKTLLP